jgi:hypothetical protein
LTPLKAKLSMANDLEGKPETQTRKTRARTNQASEQESAQNPAISDSIIKHLAYSIMRLYYRRAAFKVWQAFSVNRFELDTLIMFAAYCHKSGKRTASKRIILQTITGNSRAWKQLEGYWQGLLRLELVEAIEMTTGHETYILTKFGVHVLEYYRDAMDNLIALEDKRERTKQHAKEFKTYQDLSELPANVIDELAPQAYLRFKNR